MRRGVLLRRALIVGDKAAADKLARLISHNRWLGEDVVGRVAFDGDETLGTPDELPTLIEQNRIDVVWLCSSAEALEGPVVPEMLFGPHHARTIWRMLPQQFEMLTESELLDYRQRELLSRRVRHGTQLPIARIAMIGSRGVPASYGGIETYVQEVGTQLADLGAQVAVYCHARYVKHRGNHDGVELRFVPTIRTKHLETIVHTVMATLDALFFHEEEVFHYQAIGPSTVAWLPRVFGRKVLVTVQGLDWQRAKWGAVARTYLRFGEWCSARLPHRTVVVSRVLEEHYSRMHRKDVAFIPNGFHRAASLSPRLITELDLSKDGYILFVGRLVPEKGCASLLQAFAQVATGRRLVVAGDAAHGDGFRQELHRMGSNNHSVRFLGFVRGETLHELYSNAYFVVHPSQVEGLSISVLEALSYGNCVLVSDVPENKEAVGDDGYTFRSGDIDDLTHKLQWLMDEPAHVEAARTQARRRSETMMDWQQVTAELLHTYSELDGHGWNGAA
jgi:glycosyltransferase involved in cell wall biosynthesis